MEVFMYKDKKVFINICLIILQLPQLLVGLLLMLLLWNYKVYTNPYNHISVLKVNHKGWFGAACFSCGPIIFVTPYASDTILLHESGHSVQSTRFLILYLFIVAIPSVFLFLYRRIAKKSLYWYNSKWPESQANRLSNIDLSVYKQFIK